MTSKEIRKEFEKTVRTEKYIHFVLTLYESFPPGEKLFFWQEQLLNNFSNEHDIEPIAFETVYEIFSHFSIHNYELKNDNVPIVDRNKIVSKASYERSGDLFPMANVNTSRNLERFNYSKNVDVVYCEKCREININDINLSLDGGRTKSSWYFLNDFLCKNRQ